MNLRGLIIAVVILAGLGGLLYWSQHRKPPAESSTLPASTTILKVVVPDVTQLVIKQKQAEPITLDKATDGKWQITTPKAYRADQEAVIGMLSTLSGLPADRVVDNQASDRKPYGLDPPAVELDITGKNHATHQLLLGDDTPAGGDAYAALAGDPRIFTIASYNKSSLDKSLNDLRDKALLTVNPDKVSHLALIEKPQTMEFGRTKDGWQILKPTSGPADASTVNELLSTLTSARMDLSASAANDAATQFAHGTPVATAKLTGDTGVQTLEVRKNKDEYYAKSSVVEGAYKVDAGVGTAFNKKLDDFRKKKQT